MIDFEVFLRQKQVLLLDGAMGTELERRGVPTPLPAWSAKALVTHPYIIDEIYREYIAAGADIITTNTFRTNRRAMRNAGMEHQARTLTTIAVKLAREAILKYATKEIFVAGSVAPVEDCYSPDIVPDETTLFQEHGEFISWLADDGVDVILIETMNRYQEAYAALNAAKKACSFPVFLSMVCKDGTHLLSGELLETGVRGLSALHPDALLVNCSSPSITTAALRALSAMTTLPFGGYANAGIPDFSSDNAHGHLVSPDEYCTEMRAWIELGASIIGGCCGTTPEYIGMMRKNIDETKAFYKKHKGDS